MIYLDYAASTPVCEEALREMERVMRELYGNASSEDHLLGQRAAAAIQTARQEIAEMVGGSPRHLIFTSGATEAINLALRGFVKKRYSRAGRPLRILSSPVEHPAVLATLTELEADGFVQLYFCRVDHSACPIVSGKSDSWRNSLSQNTETTANGRLGTIEEILEKEMDLCVLMAANNEIGSIFPIRQIANLCRKYGVLFFCDASQLAGKLPFDMEGMGISALVFSAHKMYGPLGIGALVLSDDFLIEPILSGGGQQKGLRPGTPNTPAIAAWAAACRLRKSEIPEESARLSKLRNILIEELQTRISKLKIHTPVESKRKAQGSAPEDYLSLPGYLHFSVPGIQNKIYVQGFADRLAIATSSACHSGQERPSHVLEAMQLSREEMQGAFRISLGRLTSEEDVRRAAAIFCEGL